MKSLSHLVSFILLATLSHSAWSAVSDSCEARSMQLAAAARQHFLETCLAQTNSPEHIRALAAEEKRATCEQNAKNMKLEGGRKADYLNTCANKNDAVVEARRHGVDNQVATAAVQPQHASKAASGAHKPEKAVHKRDESVKPHPKRTAGAKRNCSREATRKGLKDKARSQFMIECRKG